MAEKSLSRPEQEGKYERRTTGPHSERAIKTVREQSNRVVELPASHLLRVKVCDSWEELEALWPTWVHLLETSQTASVFSTPEWLGAWWRAFGNGNSLVAIVFYDPSGDMVGLAPFYLDVLEAPFRWRLKRLRLIGDGSGDSDNLDFVVRPGYEYACARTLLNWLGRQSMWNLCELNTLPMHSPLANCLLVHLRELGWPHVMHHQRCSAIILPDSWESYLNQISAKEREKVGYRFRRLEKRYRVSTCKCTQEEEVSPFLEELFQLHQKRWQLRGQPGSFSSSVRRQFYYEVACSFLARQWLEFWLLKLDGRPVAAQFGFRYRDTVFALQRGFDPTYAADSVGYVLLGYVLRHLIADGVRRYDFLGGDSEQKQRWGAQRTTSLHIHFARPLTKGGLYLRLMRDARAAKEWLRVHLPPRAWILLRELYHGLQGVRR